MSQAILRDIQKCVFTSIAVFWHDDVCHTKSSWQRLSKKKTFTFIKWQVYVHSKYEELLFIHVIFLHEEQHTVYDPLSPSARRRDNYWLCWCTVLIVSALTNRISDSEEKYL